MKNLSASLGVHSWTTTVVTRLALGVAIVLMITAHMGLAFFAPLGLDEYGTWWVTRGSFLDAALHTFPYSPHPLFYGLVWMTTSVFGDSVFALRLVPTLSMCLGIVLVHRYLKAHCKLSALSTGSLLVLLPCLINRLTARPYSLGLLFGLCSILYASRGLERKNCALAFLFCCLAFITHQSFITVFFMPLSIYLFESSKPHRTKLTAMIALVLASGLFVQLISLLWGQMTTLESARAAFYYTHANLPSYLVNSPLPLLMFLALCVTLLSAAIDAIVIGHRDTARKIVRSASARAGGLIILGVFAIILALSIMAGTSLLCDRYLLIAALGLLMIVGCVLGQLQSPVSLASFIIVSLVVSPLHLSAQKKELYRESGWRSLVKSSHVSDKQTRRLLIVETPHAQAFLPENNGTARFSSAWTSPIDYYLSHGDDTVVLPLVNGAISPSDSSEYTLPWGSIKLTSFHVVELYSPEYRYPPAVDLAAALHKKLLDLSYTIKEKRTLGGISKILFTKED